MELILEYLRPCLEGAGLGITILVIVCIALGLLVFRFANQLIKFYAEKIANGEHVFVKHLRKQRNDSVAKINRLLRELMGKLQADEAAIFEYHNGGYNLTGLPFMHFTLALQLNPLGVDEINKDFENMLVSSVPDFMIELDKNDIYYVDHIDELKITFPRLYRALKESDMQSALFCNLEGVDDEVGFLMVAFKEEPDCSRKKIQKELFKKAQKITSFLDGKK